MHVGKYSERGTFLIARLRYEQISDKDIFLTKMGNRDTFLMALFRAKGMFLVRFCLCDKLFSGYPLGINYIFFLKFEETSQDKGMFMMKRPRKGCDSTTMSFRAMGPVENPLDTHVNMGLNRSGLSGEHIIQSYYSIAP